MRYLLDTHIALWALSSPEKIPEQYRDIIENEKNTIYYSVASVWEIAIKHKIHPEQIPMSEDEFVSLCEKTGFSKLDIMTQHISAIKGLERREGAAPHNDPFDRLLIAQAKNEGISFVTHDSLLEDYGEGCIIKI